MFNDIVLYLITPLMLFGILRNIYGLLREDENSEHQMKVLLGVLFGGAFTGIFVFINRKFLHFDHWSFDPVAHLLSRNLTIGLLIAICAAFSTLTLDGIANLKQKGLQPHAAAAYTTLFIFLIYLGYYNLALKTVAAIMLLGFLLGIGLKKILDLWE